MLDMKIVWTPPAQASFDLTRKRAIASGVYPKFMKSHNEMILILRDSDLAFEKGELMFRTRKFGGEVRVFVHGGLSVSYTVFRDEKAGWINKYSGIGKIFGE